MGDYLEVYLFSKGLSKPSIQTIVEHIEMDMLEYLPDELFEVYENYLVHLEDI